MTPEKIAEIEQVTQGLKVSRHSEADQSRAAFAFNAIPELITEIRSLQAEVTRWQERARLYHNHLVMLQGDTEAVIQ